MRVLALPLIAAAVATVAVSCSPNPTLLRESEKTASLRAQYIQSNPDGKFNAQIEHSEIVKGMGVMEVLASWGLPNWRQASETATVEFWGYYVRDKYTDTYTSYDLVFDDGTLSRWVVREDIGSYDELMRRSMAGFNRTSTEDLGRLGDQVDTGALKKK